MGTVKIQLTNKSAKQALDEWEEFLEGIRASTPVDANETPEEQAARKKRLEKPGNEEEWFEYYFPKFCFSKSAKFQRLSTERVLAAKRMYQRRAWARGLSKSTRRMFEIFYKMLVHKWRINMLLISKNEGNAIRLLAPYRANLEANPRIIKDYGTQQRVGKWSEDEFITRSKSSFRAVGMGQNPRGARLDEMRTNVLIFDDADDDEVCLNPERLDKHWKWIEQSVIPTVEISADYLICFDNNIIAEDSIAVRAGLKATDVELVNIVDENGNSVWPEKNSAEDIAFIKKSISYESYEQEYMNNPMTNGKTFKEMHWGKCPPMHKLPFLLQYADPATSNQDKPSAKSKANNSMKGTGLFGYYKGKFYMYTCFLDNMNNSHFIDGLFAVKKYVSGQNKILYSYLENNTLQDPFYQQVLRPMIVAKNKETGADLSIFLDEEKKPEKWSRIEADLEPLVRNAELILNIDEKENPHMQRMETQFLKARPTSKELGGPDLTQGAVKMIKQKLINLAVEPMKLGGRKPNSKRF